MIRDCALFYTDFLKKGDDGLYHVFPSNQGEDGFSGNPKDYTDRAQVMQHMRYCLRAAIQASEVLGVDAGVAGRLARPTGPCSRRRRPASAGACRAGKALLRIESAGIRFRPSLRSRPATLEGPPWPPAGDGALVWYFGQYPIGVHASASLRASSLPTAISRWCESLSSDGGGPTE